MLGRRPEWAGSSARGPGEKLEAAPRVRATVRIKVQLLFLFVLVAVVGAAPAGAGQYTVVTCDGQAAATGGWTLFASGPNTALSENCAARGGSMAAVLAGDQAPAASNAGWQF